jgi:hypothetical protein
MKRYIVKKIEINNKIEEVIMPVIDNILCQPISFFLEKIDNTNNNPEVGME